MVKNILITDKHSADSFKRYFQGKTLAAENTAGTTPPLASRIMECCGLHVSIFCQRMEP
jgi:hypothetical protein